MKTVNVFAKIEVEKDKIKEAKELLEKLVNNSREDKGAISYTLNRDADALHIFYMLEEWESEKALDDHMEQEHFVMFGKESENIVTDIVINKFIRVI